jgi:hypothetical protein
MIRIQPKAVLSITPVPMALLPPAGILCSPSRGTRAPVAGRGCRNRHSSARERDNTTMNVVQAAFLIAALDALARARSRKLSEPLIKKRAPDSAVHRAPCSETDPAPSQGYASHFLEPKLVKATHASLRVVQPPASSPRAAAELPKSHDSPLLLPSSTARSKLTSELSIDRVRIVLTIRSLLFSRVAFPIPSTSNLMFSQL